MTGRSLTMPSMGKQDALESAKLAQNGELAKQETAKDIVTKVVLAARKALPDGIPDGSPYAKASRDTMLNDAALRKVDIAPLLSENDLRFVMEHERLKIMTAPLAGNPADAKPQPHMPPVPMQPTPPPRRKIRGLKESPTGKWRVVNREPKTVSVGGAITKLHMGTVVERRHYTDVEMQGMVEQGVEFEPIADDDDAWE
jgi:hypothetical protein